ncbi:MAG: trypsin-like peptidase domain-containing protein, partial [Elusimicrobiales bacterium]|nr:trypsin-like peptidase domain-containing protein [Elusimicrobiales bacterium]
MKAFPFILSLFFLISSALPAAAQDAARSLQKTFNDAAAKAGRAVVSIEVVREGAARVIEPEYFFGYMMPTERIYRYDIEGVGSGVIVDPDGYILTNYHVVEGAKAIKVKMLSEKGSERILIAEPVGGDAEMDLAVLKMRSDRKFPYLRLAADKTPKIGDWVIAVGFPFGLRQTVTAGIVSARGISLKIQGRNYSNLLQTDAAINQGNSGGALLDIDGDVIGINTAIISPSGAFAGMSYAVPAAEAARVFSDVRAGRRVRRGWLGVALLRTDPVMLARLGVRGRAGGIINEVIAGSPAEEAGLRRGDIIVSCDGSPVESNEDLIHRIYTRRPGDKADIVFLRDGREMSVSVTLAGRPEA